MASLSQNERVILVGHNLGGASVSHAMQLFPRKVSVAVFLTAFMPGPSLPLSDLFPSVVSRLVTELDNNGTFDNGPDNPPTTFTFGPKYISQVLCQFSPPKDAALITLLVRPQRVTTGEEVVFTEAKYGSVKRVYIISDQDQNLPVDYQMMMIKRNPPNKVVTIRGSDHMVMMSQPIKLLHHLLNISKNFA